MTSVFFEVNDDVERDGRWFLGDLFADGRHVDGERYTYGEHVSSLDRVSVLVDVQDSPLDFTFGVLDPIVVRPWVGELIKSFEPEAVELTEVSVAGQAEPFNILNIVSAKSCLDLPNSGHRIFWTDEELRAFPGRRTGKLGLELIMDAAVDPARASGSHIFRLAEYDQCVFVSAPLKEALEARNITGVTFRLATPTVR